MADADRETAWRALVDVDLLWRPAIEFARITSAGEAREFDEAGFAKTVYDLSVPELGASRTLLSA